MPAIAVIQIIKINLVSVSKMYKLKIKLNFYRWNFKNLINFKKIVFTVKI